MSKFSRRGFEWQKTLVSIFCCNKNDVFENKANIKKQKDLEEINKNKHKTP